MRLIILAILFLGLFSPSLGEAEQQQVIRFGHFPNITHAHGLIAHGRTRAGTGWFEQRISTAAKIEWHTYNAGPLAMEAIMAGALDLTFVGPNPAINAYVRSRGEEIRVIAGATLGGAGLVVRADAGIKSPKDFIGKKIATPQFGNTQDVAARSWLISNGIRVTQTGGDAQVIPTDNADQPALFGAKRIDAAWTVEPWLTRLEESGGEIFLVEDKALTVVLVARAKFAAENPELIGQIIKAQAELTHWINSNRDAARGEVQAELKAETRRDVSAELVGKAFSRMSFTSGVSLTQFKDFVISAQTVGFLKEVGDISGLLYVPKS